MMPWGVWILLFFVLACVAAVIHDLYHGYSLWPQVEESREDFCDGAIDYLLGDEYE